MPPKNASKGGASQSKKAENKKKEKIIEVILCLIFLKNCLHLESLQIL